MKNFKITRDNFIKVVIVVYAIIIAAVLGAKWLALVAYQKKIQAQAEQAAAASGPVDYGAQFKALKSVVAKESKEFLEVAKERMAGENVARMSDLDEIVEGALTNYFDEDARRIRAEAKRNASKPSGEPGEPKFVAAPRKVLNENLNPKIRLFLVGLGSLIQELNAKDNTDTDVIYEMDDAKTEFVTLQTTRAELAGIIFADEGRWTVSFDASAASGEVLGGIQFAGSREFYYEAALVEIRGEVVFVDQADGKPRFLSTDQLLAHVQGLLARESSEARARVRLARAGQTGQL